MRTDHQEDKTSRNQPAAEERRQRIWDIQGMLQLGIYRIPAEVLAPILEKVIFPTRQFNDPRREASLPNSAKQFKDTERK